MKWFAQVVTHCIQLTILQSYLKMKQCISSEIFCYYEQQPKVSQLSKLTWRTIYCYSVSGIKWQKSNLTCNFLNQYTYNLSCNQLQFFYGRKWVTLWVHEVLDLHGMINILFYYYNFQNGKYCILTTVNSFFLTTDKRS